MAAIPAFFSCSSSTKTSGDADSATSADGEGSSVSSASYVSLSSGQPASIVRDTASESGGYVYSETRKPIESDLIFVDVSTGDTLYGPSGTIVNNAVVQSEGKWVIDETKIKRDGDEIKIKSGDDKIKIDGNDVKVKSGDSKLKVDDGEESKVKTPSVKEKVEEDGETKVKP